jgi:hypothetical protein
MSLHFAMNSVVRQVGRSYILECIAVIQTSPEPPEEQQHDAEAELTWNNGMAPDWLVVAEKARCKVAPPKRWRHNATAI